MRLKLAVAAAVLVGGAALLGSLYAGARRRGLEAHCRNNLRHLGGLAVRNWNALDPARTGRDFWQGVREAQYRDVRGKWQPIVPDPFVCPFTGKSACAPEDAAGIDYRGPRLVREELKATPASEPLGADRPGNHPSGGHVLRIDTSVREWTPLIDAAGQGAPLWAEADKTLKD